MYDVVRGRKTTLNSTEVRPNTSAEVRFRRNILDMFPGCCGACSAEEEAHWVNVSTMVMSQEMHQLPRQVISVRPSGLLPEGPVDQIIELLVASASVPQYSGLACDRVGACGARFYLRCSAPVISDRKSLTA